jgi:predicted transcriptional regulator
MEGETEMIDRLLSSDVKADLLALFHNNPGLTDRIDGLARRIGRAANDIEADVKELIDLGALSKKTTGKSEVIYCDRKNDMKIQQIVSNRLKREHTQA